MRIKNSMKNMIYIYACTLLIVILNFVVRRIFLDVLTIDYLGYDGLFVSIFSYLNLSEMGIAGIITYHMYSEIATDNLDQIRKLLSVYRIIYVFVGLFVLAAGLIVSLFLPIILANAGIHDSWSFIFTIYYLQLAATLCTYFFAYRRIIFVTHQRIYVCTAVDTVINIISIIARMIILLKLKNYIAYLIVSIVSNITSNLIISFYSKKEYPEITETKVGREDIRALGLGAEVKNMIATKAALTVYGASDDIIITSMLGVATNGLVSNYRMISSKLQEFILSAFNSIQASIGNLVYDKESDRGIPFFKALDLTGFFLAIVSASGVMCVCQEFIVLWLKNPKLLLSYGFAAMLSLNLFIAIQNNPMTYFRNSLGHFEADRNYMITAAITNVTLSIVLGLFFGVTGVMIGTVAGHLFIYLGRCIVVHKFFLHASPKKYCLLTLGRLMLLCLSVSISTVLGNLIHPYVESALLFFLIKGMISVIVALAIFFVSSFKTESYEVLKEYVRKVMAISSGKEIIKP